MAIDITMPQLGESVTEGTVGRWLKQPGDYVEKYEPVLEVVTDKVDSEVPSPAAGTLAAIVVHEGETVRVGTVLAHLSVAGEVEVVSSDTPAVPSAAEPSAAVVSPPRKTYLSPVVARIAAEHQIDVSQITGTGAGGRVSKKDVLRFLERSKQPTAAMPAPDSPPAPVAEPSPPPVAEPSPSFAAAELIPLTPMRRAIAEHMARSVRTSPHATSIIEVDLSQIIAHRERHTGAFERQGVHLTYTAYFIQAAVAALQAVPMLNSTFSDDGILLHRRVHIGVAVALDDGLIVPVIRDADEKNLLGLARANNDLTERARTRRLSPDATQGGTFTITNHGVSGSLFATPIINQPQVGILGVGAIQKRPIVITQQGVDAIAIKPMCYCSLTFDHRSIDGAVADAFLMAVKRGLEEYEG